MIQIKPTHYLHFTCPFCNKEQRSNEILFWGLAVVAKIDCSSCQKNAFISLEIGHFVHFPCIFQNQSTLAEALKVTTTKWLHEPLLKSFFQQDYKLPKFRKTVFQKKEKVILLHCLDPVYGHTLWRLFNYAKLYQEYPDYGIILLIPENFEYLFPNPHISELWILDNSLGDFKYLMPTLNTLIKKELERFEEFYIAKAPVQPQVNQEIVEELFSQKVFPLENFAKLPPKVLFVMRNDRFWLAQKWEYFLFRIYISSKWKFLLPFLVKKQNKYFNRLSKLLKHKMPAITITAIGFGNPKGLSQNIQDLRSQKPDSSTEIQWNRLASEAQLVIGVHGSHLLIPTALSGAFIELLPSHRIENFGEANIFIQKNVRYANFLQRIMPLATPPKLVARHIVHIIKNFKFLRRLE